MSNSTAGFKDNQIEVVREDVDEIEEVHSEGDPFEEKLSESPKEVAALE